MSHSIPFAFFLSFFLLFFSSFFFHYQICVREWGGRGVGGEVNDTTPVPTICTMLNWFPAVNTRSSRNLYTQVFSQSVYASLLTICIRKSSHNLYTQIFSQSVYTSLLAICIRKSTRLLTICIRESSRNLYTEVFSQYVYASLLAFSQSVYASLLTICIHKSSRTQIFSQSVYTSLAPICMYTQVIQCWHQEKESDRDIQRLRQIERVRASSTRQTWHAECFNLSWARWTGQTRSSPVGDCTFTYITVAAMAWRVSRSSLHLLRACAGRSETV